MNFQFIKIPVKFFKRIGLAIGILFQFQSCSNSAQLVSDEFVEVVRRSNFYFAGTVLHKDSSNINIYISGRMAIVRVDSVYYTVDPFYKQQGKEITVLFSSNNVVYSEGQQLVFHSLGWYYGNTLGVKEQGNIFIFLPGIKERILAAREIINDRYLSANLEKADLVVTGKVLEIKRDTSKLYLMRSEHNPLLSSALIKVSSVIKGDKKVKNVWVYFASSKDVLWLNSPKLVKDMEAIFVLDRGKESTVIKQNEYSLFGTQDLQPLSQLQRIAKLTKN